MINDAVTSAMMSAGMKCLVAKLGIVEAEMFISVIRESSFDYTKWRQEHLWPHMSIDEIFQLAAEREKTRKTLNGKDI